MAVLEPGEAGAQVLGDAEPQALLLRGLLPVAHDVAVRPHLARRSSGGSFEFQRSKLS